MMVQIREMTRIELKLFLREPLTVVFTVVLPVVVLTILNGIFGAAPAEFYDGFRATDYYTPAYIALVIATTGVLGVSVQLAGYRERGVLRRFQASGMQTSVVIASQVLLCLIVGATAALILGALSALAYQGALPTDWLGVAAGLVLVTLVFAVAGALMGLVVPTARSAQGVGVVLFFVLLNLGGAGPPAALLPDGMATLREFVPLTPAAEVLRGPWLGLGWDAGAVVTMLAMLAVGLGLGIWRLRRELRGSVGPKNGVHQ